MGSFCPLLTVSVSHSLFESFIFFVQLGLLFTGARRWMISHHTIAYQGRHDHIRYQCCHDHILEAEAMQLSNSKLYRIQTSLIID